MKNDITRILYLCDRKKCGDNCDYPLCSHTTDIAHAASFRKTSYDTITGKTVTTYTEKAIDDVEREYFSDFTADWNRCTDLNDPMPNEGDDVLYTLIVDYSYGKGTEIVKFVCDGEYKKEKEDIYDAPASNGNGYFEMDTDYDEGQPIEVIAWMPKPEAFGI